MDSEEKEIQDHLTLDPALQMKKLSALKSFLTKSPKAEIQLRFDWIDKGDTEVKRQGQLYIEQQQEKLKESLRKVGFILSKEPIPPERFMLRFVMESL